MSINPFKRQAIPKKIPKSLLADINKFAESKNKDIILKKCFNYVVSKQKGGRLNMILKINRLSKDNFEDIWRRKGFMYCTAMNYLLRIMLVKSGFFKDEDIELKLTNTWYIVPHQYLRIKMNERKFINVDPWAYQFGIDFGNYGHGFKAGSLNSIR